MQNMQDAHSLASFAANAVRAGREPEAMQAVQRLLHLQPGFKASDAHHMFPIKTLSIRNRIQAALQEAGIPD
jgi:hypothetical protein